MNTSKEKLTRIRNPLKKEAKFQQIITIGTQLFIRDGDQMSMHELAQEVGLVVSGLYRYIQTKRELWFACSNQEFAKFSDDYVQ
ncbi:MAG: TetR/AcrR family transcriptional regulator, partial [Promethearchaeota archaeon]